MEWMRLLLPCLYAFIATAGFCLLYHLQRRILALAALGGALAWGVYLLGGCVTSNDIMRSFLAALLVSAYAELLARVKRAPVTAFLIPGILPLVPGGGIYYTMEFCIRGDMDRFLSTGLHTFGIAGAIALGILLISSLVRLYKTVRSGSDALFRRRRMEK